ncbi:nucleotide sugar epimerase [Psychromonas sp. CNPT3]|uniref:NAD-dependent epimerase n=1 Tax=Psychromonas sp. CNPT3 TaxID=314282 RepID=UPI00006E5832|nr:NAD-dependent epimerase [Psychromonas sp. CNPT3]AGH80463.1 nucleotide sugar epimerase [Psychromonas sp. CNPT3]
MKYLVTGAAGFIASAVVERLTALGHEVIGIDNLNDYYDVRLKYARLERIKNPLFTFIKMDLADRIALPELFKTQKFERVIHLGAQAGVRYSIENPFAYADSNLIGHLNILEGCRHYKIKHLIYASSSSVYGLNNEIPFSTEKGADHPVSFYAATKKANELMAHSYSHLYQLPTTGLRFFTVYGPWGRPDMALFKFTEKIINGDEIEVYNHGDMWRDFTYIDDIVEGIIRIQDKAPTQQADWTPENGSPASSSAPYAIYNIGNGEPVRLLEFIEALERALKMKAHKKFMPMQAGDVYQTFSDSQALFDVLGYKPNTSVEKGIAEFVRWYQSFYVADATK